MGIKNNLDKIKQLSQQLEKQSSYLNCCVFEISERTIIVRKRLYYILAFSFVFMIAAPSSNNNINIFNLYVEYSAVGVCLFYLNIFVFLNLIYESITHDPQKRGLPQNGNVFIDEYTGHRNMLNAQASFFGNLSTFLKSTEDTIKYLEGLDEKYKQDADDTNYKNELQNTIRRLQNESEKVMEDRPSIMGRLDNLVTLTSLMFFYNSIKRFVFIISHWLCEIILPIVFSLVILIWLSTKFKVIPFF